MAGKRITDLPLSPLIYPFDYIPAARDAQTIRVPGSAVVATHVYEPDRLVNLFSCQKYLYHEGTQLSVKDTMNNASIMIDAGEVTISFDSNSVFRLGFKVDLVSARKSMITINGLDERFSFKCLRTKSVNSEGISVYTSGGIYGTTYITDEAEVDTADWVGNGGNINSYETLRLIYIKPGIWLKMPITAGAAAITDVTVPYIPPQLIDLDPLPSLSAITIDPTGTKPDIISINSIEGDTTHIVSIGNAITTIQAINGQNAYL